MVEEVRPRFDAHLAEMPYEARSIGRCRQEDFRASGNIAPACAERLSGFSHG